LEHDGATGNLNGSSIPLTTAISLPVGGEVGLFAGYGRLVIHTGSRAYDLSTPSGAVADLGALAPLPHAYTENWADWGVAEYFDGTPHLVYVRDPQTIVRTTVPGGATAPLATFQNLSDMAVFTVSVLQDRWYFHYEGSGQFGGVSETLGYADALFRVGEMPIAPAITNQPQSRSVPAGATVTLSVGATGSPPLSYQWRKEGTNLPSIANVSFTIANVQSIHAGRYDVVVTNCFGAVTSTPAFLDLAVRPSFTVQPTNTTVLPGGDVVFHVKATGTLPIRFRWRRNGTTLTNTLPVNTPDSSTLTLTNVPLSYDGSLFTVVATNAGGQAPLSSNALLTVVRPPLLSDPVLLPDRVFQMLIQGNLHRSYLIDVSSNLLDWTPAGTVSCTDGRTMFIDVSATNGTQRFYRARLAP
jgi:hypothetical protein